MRVEVLSKKLYEAACGEGVREYSASRFSHVTAEQKLSTMYDGRVHLSI